MHKQQRQQWTLWKSQVDELHESFVQFLSEENSDLLFEHVFLGMRNRYTVTKIQSFKVAKEINRDSVSTFL